MISIAGFVFLLVCVFGGYKLAGGKMEIILLALPFEFAIIGGAAFGALLMANSMSEVKHILGSTGKILKGGKYKRQDYMELLSLLFWLVRLA
ncbi:MAG: motility-associated protein, partial [Alphaproteobacteria bacterium]